MARSGARRKRTLAHTVRKWLKIIVPPELLSEALDRETMLVQGEWQICPMARSALALDLVAVYGAPTSKRTHNESLLKAWSILWQAARKREAERTHVARLEAILKLPCLATNPGNRSVAIGDGEARRDC